MHGAENSSSRTLTISGMVELAPLNAMQRTEGHWG